jgi:chemotaxis signal transduction protein
VSNETGESGAEPAQSSVAPEAGELVDGLECRIGRARFGVPTDAIARILEYRTMPLPLAKQWIGGIGVHEGAPLLSVALRPSKEREKEAGGAATAKGILLKVPTSSIAWALEVQEVFAFVRARVVAVREVGSHRLPRWISIATTDDGRSLGWVHVGAMLAELASVSEARP